MAVINQRLAEQAFLGQDPVGCSLRLAAGEWTEREIVGVVGNLRHDSLLSEARPEIYRRCGSPAGGRGGAGRLDPHTAGSEY